MTQIEILGILAPIMGGLVVIVTAFVVTHFDNKAAEAERRSKLSSGKDDAARMASAAE
ncbi:hypothetical protein [Tardiphaga alba]|uniref:hypothetical protein n=1 Tax=Tardiphaga alba TaxID=340268 RepID=UPI001BA59952|nr:hypothetical protein [Tardiphaga alba]